MDAIKRWCYRPGAAGSTFSRLLKPIGEHPGFFLFAAIVPTFPDILYAVSRRFSSDDRPHLLPDLAGIRCPWYDPTRSLVNDRFDNARPSPLLLGYEPAGDYDVLIREQPAGIIRRLPTKNPCHLKEAGIFRPGPKAPRISGYRTSAAPSTAPAGDSAPSASNPGPTDGCRRPKWHGRCPSDSPCR